jgi:hypothetical protein
MVTIVSAELAASNFTAVILLLFEHVKANFAIPVFL